MLTTVSSACVFTFELRLKLLSDPVLLAVSLNFKLRESTHILRPHKHHSSGISPVALCVVFVRSFHFQALIPFSPSFFGEVGNASPGAYCNYYHRLTLPPSSISP